MRFWQRLREALHWPKRTRERDRTGEEQRGYDRAAGRDAGAGSLASTPPALAERQLRQLLDSISDKRSGTPPRVGDAAFFVAIDRLVDAGRERTAIDLLRRFAELLADEPAIAARFAELLIARLEYDEAMPVLERITTNPPHALRAHVLLAEGHERKGDHAAAGRHHELALALDLDHPGLWARHLRLREAAARSVAPTMEFASTPSSTAPTLMGLDSAERDGLSPEIASRYRLRRELGRGASATVYLAVDEELGREVALKLLHPQARAQARAQRRAEAFNEARLAARLRHPGVLAIYDLDDERGLIAMERCGETLRARLSRGPLCAAEARDRIREILATLEVVHGAGVIHRDLKPANLLFRPAPPLEGERDALVLGDFGLARLVQDRGAALATPDAPDGEASAIRSAMGTWAYLSSEARRGEACAASDVYAAGVILVETLAGTLPVDRAALLRAPLLPSEAEPALRRAETPAALSRLALRLLDPDPAARPTAAEALALLDGR